MTAREHGTRAKYVVERCRCDDCRRACRDYERWRSKQHAMGRQPYVDAMKAREHIAWLRDNGLGLKRIAALSGVSHGALWKLVYGKPGRGPSKRIRVATGRRITAVMPRLERLADGARVDATTTHGQLRALREAGWTWRALGERVGVDGSNLCAVLNRPQVSARLARAVRDLYRTQLQPPADAVRQPGGPWKAKLEREAMSA